MTGRFVDHGSCILLAVALLLAVMCSPIRATRASQTARSPDYHPRSLVILGNGYSGQAAMSARRSSRAADSLQFDLEDFDLEDELDADLEDELTVTSPPASGFFDALPTPCREPYLELDRRAVRLASRPLRC